MRKQIGEELENGLVLRQAVPEDTEQLVAFHSDVHREPGTQDGDKRIAASTWDLLEGRHPTFRAGDFTIVEDTRTRAIVSSTSLISQTWSYGGVQFGVGRPELVGTLPDYRRRGLISAQMQVIHDWSAERGQKLQAITGIPWYYRQFGYEPALALGGGRVGYRSQIPKLKDGETEPFRVRMAKGTDLPFIAETYERGSRRSLVACVRNEASWQFELGGRREKSIDRRELCIPETPAGEPVGFLAHPRSLSRGRAAATAYELKPGVSWLAVTPTVMRYLWATGEQACARRDAKQTLDAFAFLLGIEHPVYRAMDGRLPQTVPPYAWHLRVPDLPGFIQHVAPVLECRLENSVLVGHCGEIKLNFYRHGLRLLFEGGRLASVGSWQPETAEAGHAGFPDLTFLQLLFGYRTLAELRYAFPDCWTKDDETPALLEVLFPKQPSTVWPMG